MLTIESMCIHANDESDWEINVKSRQLLIEDAIKKGDLERLQAISNRDKENINILIQMKNKIADELLNLKKIEAYLEL